MYKKINFEKPKCRNFSVKDIPELTKVSEELSEQTKKKYKEYLMKLRENLNSRFLDLFSFEVQP